MDIIHSAFFASADGIKRASLAKLSAYGGPRKRHLPFRRSAIPAELFIS